MNWSNYKNTKIKNVILRINDIDIKTELKIIKATLVQACGNQVFYRIPIYKNAPFYSIFQKVVDTAWIYVEGAEGYYSGEKQIVPSNLMVLSDDFPLYLFRRDYKLSSDLNMLNNFMNKLEYKYKMIVNYSIGSNNFNEKKFSSFITCHAGITYHANFKGGLLVHECNMLKLLDMIMNKEVQTCIMPEKITKMQQLITAIILHDCMKPFEYKWLHGEFKRNENTNPHQVLMYSELSKINDFSKLLSNEELCDLQNMILGTHSFNASYSRETKMLCIIDSIESGLNRSLGEMTLI